MPPKEANKINECKNCGSTFSDGACFCPTCNSSVGFPNVRFSNSANNRSALAMRIWDARKKIISLGHYSDFLKFRRFVIKKSNVIVSMPSGVFRSLMTDPKKIYCNYEKLVNSGVMHPRAGEFDKKRHAASGILFGSYCNDIVYGALSLSEEGLSTYGSVFCQLRPITIMNRTSFLEENSYRFIEKHQKRFGDPLPYGYWANWNTRHLLALVKNHSSFAAGLSKEDWGKLLFSSDGKDRNNDDFIEAHIFGTFNGKAIASAIASSTKKFSKNEKLDLQLGLAKLSNLRK